MPLPKLSDDTIDVSLIAIGGVLLLAISFHCMGCGGPAWTPADTKSASDAVRVEIAAQEVCAEDDGGCRPALVRALQRSAICNTSSMLVRHGASAPDGGITCRAQ